MSTPTARKPAADDSRGNGASRVVSGASPALRALVLAAGLTGAVLLIVSDFSTLIEVKAVTAVIKRIPGHSQHSYAMLILGVFALGMTVGAVRGGSRPAMLALTLIGLIAGGIAVVGDLPDVHETGLIGQQFESASASPKAGFYLETLGAALLIFGGGGALILSAPARAEGRERRRREAAAETAKAKPKPKAKEAPAETASERAERRRREREAEKPKPDAKPKTKASGDKKPAPKKPATKGSAREAESRARAAEKAAAKDTPTEKKDPAEEADGARPPEKPGAQARTSRRRRRR